MKQIIDIQYFNKENSLYIPLAVGDPNTGAPDNQGDLGSVCKRVEKELLINALGLELYNLLQLALDDNFVNPIYERFKFLVKGQEYDGKIWKGLDYEYSLIAQRIFEVFNTENNIRLSAVGTVKANPENATLATPVYLIANANQNFIAEYQGSYCAEPHLYKEVFIDWYYNESVYKSLYGYLQDKQGDFPEWSVEKFKAYEIKNSFGI
jgi:hypothetical protein